MTGVQVNSNLRPCEELLSDPTTGPYLYSPSNQGRPHEHFKNEELHSDYTQLRMMHTHAMIERNCVYNHEILQIVFVWNVITMPGHDIKGRVYLEKIKVKMRIQMKK